MKSVLILCVFTLFLFGEQTTLICSFKNELDKCDRFVVNTNSISKPTTLTWFYPNGQRRAIFQTSQTKLDWEESSKSLFKIESNGAYLTAALNKTAPYRLTIEALNKNTNHHKKIEMECVVD